jgi:hypothetical protein
VGEPSGVFSGVIVGSKCQILAKLAKIRAYQNDMEQFNNLMQQEV